MSVTTTWVLYYDGHDAFSSRIWKGVLDPDGRRDFRYPPPPSNSMSGTITLTPFEHGLDNREDALRFCAFLLRAWKEVYGRRYILTAHLSERADQAYKPVVAMFDSVDKEMSGMAHSSLRYVNYMKWPEIT